jgi:hypothetical protein
VSQLSFDPHTDLPPDGATVDRDGCTVRYDAGSGWWRIEAGPDHLIGAIAWPFSDGGIAIATLYAARPTEGDTNS